MEIYIITLSASPKKQLFYVVK